MKILVLQGSPRPDGNTQAVLDIVLDTAMKAGAQAEVVHLSALKSLTGCIECYGCQKVLNEPGCVIEDDLQPVLAKAVAADVIVWATPVFCWAPSWLTKMAQDRFYCMFKFKGGEDYACLIEGRKTAAVITAGGSDDDGADLVLETCRRMARFSRTVWVGALVAANIRSADGVRADVELRRKAEEFGRKLVQ